MKTIKLLTIVVLLVTFGAISAQAKIVSVKIKTSAVCESCKARLEKALSTEAGVTSSNLDIKSKELTVVFDDGKTSPEKIKQAISKTGYDADDVKADLAASKKLPGCCKKEACTKS